ncbi:K03245 translation initiation factor eIF-3 subunit 1 [Cyberlindnera jadinii]|uniref:Eukaryotic translation initiation factor 3 subunit J n=1 Tax=Cyberlindnera jadinii (strain ATCC 18201 / CBS 1600 / BCRC 20928 / JCM 3617 / NBRC 0987 / NRRL Y-1542) TaxID=983966 RepID=A0A0H5C5D8_CYBJN|nr:K03245 translation initiation factor eIF-3 subunit 1 [Cyberlindnera jadinii]
MSWDDDDFEVPATSNAKVAESWDDDFAADDDDVLESWDAEEVEEKPKPKPKAKASTTAKSSAKTAGKKVITSELDSVDEKTRKELQRKAELEADLNNAADLFGGLGLNEHPREKALKAAAEAKAQEQKLTIDTPLSAHPIFNPETKQDYEKLRKALTTEMNRLAEQSSLNYASSLAIDLTRDMFISTLNVVLKDKERAERQARLSKAGGTATGGAGKKKAKAAKPNLGGAFKKDQDIVVDNYDDFADDDFM